MKIFIKSDDKKMVLVFPNLIFFNAPMLRLAENYSGGAMPHIPSKSVRKLRKTIRKMKKIHKGWELVDVQSSNGDVVKIKM